MAEGSIQALTMPVLPPPPPQITDRLTGYPTWRSPYPGWDAQQLDAVTFMSFAGCILGLALALRYRPSLFSRQASTSTLSPPITVLFSDPTALFTTLITFYLVGTLITVGGFWMIDVGKVWVVTGTLHNAMELGLLMVVAMAKRGGAGKEEDGFRWFWGYLFVYWAYTQAMCIMLPWPHDAIYFKFQGLILDFALVINFARLLRSNLPSSQGAITLPTTTDGSIPKNLTAGRAIPIHQSSSSSSPSDSDSAYDTHHATSPSTLNPNIHLLLLAAFIHLAGNCITVLSLSKYPFLVFQFTYGITYPIYGYFVARSGSGGDMRIRWFETSKGKEAAVAVVSTVAAGVVSLVGIKIGLDYYGKP